MAFAVAVDAASGERAAIPAGVLPAGARPSDGGVVLPSRSLRETGESGRALAAALPRTVVVAAAGADDQKVRSDVETAAATARALRLPAGFWLAGEVALARALAADPACRAQVASLLTPLFSGDRRRGELLGQALDAYLDAGLSVRRAARALGVHRHTVENRLERVEQLLAVDLTRAPDRLMVELASFARRAFERGAHRNDAQ